MNKTDLFHALTLWFVVMIFLQTASGNAGGSVLPIIGIIAVALLYIIPVYVLLGAGLKLFDYR